MIFNELQQLQMKQIMLNHTTLNKIQLYKNNNSSSWINDILIKQMELNNSKKFGIMMEDITQQLFNMDNSTSSEHDKIKNGYKIEIKTSTMLSKDLLKNRKTFQYNSVRLNYDYDYLMLCNVNFNSLDYYLISKVNLNKLNFYHNQKSYKNNRIITMIRFSDIEKYLVEVNPNNISNILN